MRRQATVCGQEAPSVGLRWTGSEVVLCDPPKIPSDIHGTPREQFVVAAIRNAVHHPDLLSMDEGDRDLRKGVRSDIAANAELREVGDDYPNCSGVPRRPLGGGSSTLRGCPKVRCSTSRLVWTRSAAVAGVTTATASRCSTRPRSNSGPNTTRRDAARPEMAGLEDVVTVEREDRA